MVSASATNTDASGTTFTMPRYWRSARSGITMDEAVSMSCTQPNRNAAAVTAASIAQSFAVIGRLLTRKLSMPPYYATPPRHAIPQAMYVRESSQPATARKEQAALPLSRQIVTRRQHPYPFAAVRFA